MDTTKPAKQPLKRRRCPNCNKVFQPTRRWARFHSDKCRKEFHRYGAGYYPIKAGLEKAIEEKYTALAKQVHVELKELRAKIDALVGQFERHTHEFYTDGSAGEIQTLAPTEIRDRDRESWNQERLKKPTARP